VDEEFEIHGQHLMYNSSGAIVETGTNDFRISHMGAEYSTTYEASEPAVAYDSENLLYLVVWHGDDNTYPLVNDEFDIFYQQVDVVSSTLLMDDDYRLSDMGPDGFTDFWGMFPDVAFGIVPRNFLVTWHGTVDSHPAINGEVEAFSQLYTASDLLYLPITIK
jgi:hypothetical protein